MAVITLWMGIGSAFITGRTATASQSVIDQMQRPPRAYDVVVPAKPALPVQQPGKTASSPALSSASGAAKQNSVERLGTR
jgi:hypothetical protein